MPDNILTINMNRQSGYVDSCRGRSMKYKAAVRSDKCRPVKEHTKEQSAMILFPVGKRYSVIYADPPWQYSTKSPLASPRPESCQRAGGAEYYYPTMPTEEIMKLPILKITEKNAVLFLWATNPFLHEAFHVAEAWGFKYKTMITWHKLGCKGMGYWFRGHTEHLLVAARGNVKPFRSLKHNIVDAPVMRHSEKPEIFRQIVNEVTPSMSKIELFARSNIEGWDSWGNCKSLRSLQQQAGEP